MRRIRAMRRPAKGHERRSRPDYSRDRDRGLERLFQRAAATPFRTAPGYAAERRAGAIGGSRGAAPAFTGASRRGSAHRTALTLWQSTVLRRLRQALLRIALEHRLRRNRRGVLVWTRISRDTNLDARAL